jgi:hypothetical protein
MLRGDFRGSREIEYRCGAEAMVRLRSGAIGPEPDVMSPDTTQPANAGCVVLLKTPAAT